jgi:hypothetical protein
MIGMSPLARWAALHVGFLLVAMTTTQVLSQYWAFAIGTVWLCVCFLLLNKIRCPQCAWPLWRVWDPTSEFFIRTPLIRPRRHCTKCGADLSRR